MIVEAEALTVRYRRGLRRKPFFALDGLSLQVREGDFFALLGQNGAGKSTAMHCLLGLLRPSGGAVRIWGRAPSPGSDLFARIGYLPEEPRYHDYLTVEEAVTYYARLSGLRTPQPFVTTLLDRLGLEEARRLAIRKCSKGMKQKVGIAQCLVHSPQLLLLDEPMRGLDPITVHTFRDMLVELNRNGVTIVMNSHLLAEVELVANRIAIIDRGKLLVQDDVSAIVAAASERYAVEVEGAEDTPPHLSDVVTASGRLRATLAAADLFPFLDYARAKNLRIVSCALDKQTLEQRFVAILGKAGGHA